MKTRGRGAHTPPPLPAVPRATLACAVKAATQPARAARGGTSGLEAEVWHRRRLCRAGAQHGRQAQLEERRGGFEVAALILLLGAQVIAEFERCGLPGVKDGSGFNTGAE